MSAQKNTFNPEQNYQQKRHIQNQNNDFTKPSVIRRCIFNQKEMQLLNSDFETTEKELIQINKLMQKQFVQQSMVKRKEWQKLDQQYRELVRRDSVNFLKSRVQFLEILKNLSQQKTEPSFDQYSDKIEESVEYLRTVKSFLKRSPSYVEIEDKIEQSKAQKKFLSHSLAKEQTNIRTRDNRFDDLVLSLSDFKLPSIYKLN